MKSEMLIQNSKNKIVEKEEKEEHEDDLYDDSRSVAVIKSRENKKAMGKLQRKFTQFKEMGDASFD